MGALFLASGASTGMAAISLLLFLSGEAAGEGFRKVKRADRYAMVFELLVLAVFLVLLGSAAAPITSGNLAPRSSGAGSSWPACSCRSSSTSPATASRRWAASPPCSCSSEDSSSAT